MERSGPRPTTRLARAALLYASHGWPVFPLQPKGKQPLTRHGFKDASTIEGQIIEWWTRWPNANIGFPTGTVADVLDVDSDEGFVSLVKLTEEHGRCLPVFAMALTGKGAHYYLTPLGIGNKARFRPGLDYRGDGGYVVLPPSVHETGHIYEWDVRPWPKG